MVIPTKRIGECEVIPRGWGFAYQEVHLYAFVVAPIPFNVFLGLCKRIEYWLTHNPLAARPKGCLKCFEAGFYRGRQMQDLDFINSYTAWLERK